jgi:hypothetical protein
MSLEHSFSSETQAVYEASGGNEYPSSYRRQTVVALLAHRLATVATGNLSNAGRLKKSAKSKLWCGKTYSIGQSSDLQAVFACSLCDYRLT